MSLNIKSYISEKTDISLEPQFKFKFKFKLMLILVLGLSVFFTGEPAEALELNSRLSGVEETDDILKPSVGFEVSAKSGLSSALTYWGRDFGPVSERRYLLTVFYKFQPLKSKLIRASLGGSVLNEITSINYDSPYDHLSVEDVEYNLGGLFGVYFRFFEGASYLFEGHWESSIFPAGQAGMLLVTGRKQTIGLSFGVKL